MEQALEWALVAKQILRQVRIRSLLLLLPSTWNPKPVNAYPGSFPNLPLFQYPIIPDVWRNIELP